MDDAMSEPTQKPMVVRCNWCLAILTEPGALVFTPPDAAGQCVKIHVCVGCYARVIQPGPDRQPQIVPDHQHPNRGCAEGREQEAWDQRYKHGKAARTWDAIAAESTDEVRRAECAILAKWMAAYEAADAQAEQSFRDLRARSHRTSP